MVAAVVEQPERLVFVERVRDAYLIGTALYGYAPKGERLYLCRYPGAGPRTLYAAF